MTDTWDWTRTRGDEHEIFSGQLTETIENADGTITTQPIDLTSCTVAAHFTVAAPNNEPGSTTSLIAACTVTGDPTQGHWSYDPDASFAALSSGITHLRIVVTAADTTTRTFPEDDVTPYLLGLIRPATF